MKNWQLVKLREGKGVKNNQGRSRKVSRQKRRKLVKLFTLRKAETCRWIFSGVAAALCSQVEYLQRVNDLVKSPRSGLRHRATRKDVRNLTESLKDVLNALWINIKFSFVFFSWRWAENQSKRTFRSVNVFGFWSLEIFHSFYATRDGNWKISTTAIIILWRRNDW